MAAYFSDSSALVKGYVSEVGSAWILELFDSVLENETWL